MIRFVDLSQYAIADPVVELPSRDEIVEAVEYVQDHIGLHWDDQNEGVVSLNLNGTTHQWDVVEWSYDHLSVTTVVVAVDDYFLVLFVGTSEVELMAAYEIPDAQELVEDSQKLCFLSPNGPYARSEEFTDEGHI